MGRRANPSKIAMSSDGGEVAVTAETAAALLVWGTCPALYHSYGLCSVRGRLLALTDALVAVPSFTLLSPPLGLDYFGVFDGHFGAAIAKHLTKRLHGAIAEQIERELLVETPRFDGSHVEGWWRTTIVEAFRTVHDEVLAGGVGDDGPEAGATALVALVLEEYFVLANCGLSRAVICRAGEAVQLTSEHRPDRPDEKQRVESAGGLVGESCRKVGHVLPTSRAFGTSPYKAYVTAVPEVAAVVRHPRDEFLILATDGLWDYVTPAEACGFVKQKLRCWSSRITMPWVEARRLEGACRGSPTKLLAMELGELAMRAGSQDNVSIIVILLGDSWSAPDDDASRASPVPSGRELAVAPSTSAREREERSITQPTGQPEGAAGPAQTVVTLGPRCQYQ